MITNTPSFKKYLTYEEMDQMITKAKAKHGKIFYAKTLIQIDMKSILETFPNIQKSNLQEGKECTLLYGGAKLVYMGAYPIGHLWSVKGYLPNGSDTRKGIDWLLSIILLNANKKPKTK